ncbi:MAG: hypothetical protein V4439_02935 [Patescibacteria group bacterium]
MPNKTLILCNESKLNFSAIEERVQSSRLLFDVHYAQHENKVLSLIPQHGHCVIVTEAVLPGENIGPNKTGAVLRLVKDAKKKNPACYIILYAFSPEYLEEGEDKKFDFVLNQKKENSYDLLFKKLHELSRK